MTKYINCVFVKHQLCNKPFLFALPPEVTVDKGTNIMCSTRIGNAEGVAACDSFTVSEHALESIAAAIGAYLPLSEVIGTVKIKTVMVESKSTEFFNDLPF